LGAGWKNGPDPNFQRFDIGEDDALQFSARDLLVNVPVGQHGDADARDAGCSHRIDGAGREGTTNPNSVHFAATRERPIVHRMKLNTWVADQVVCRGGLSEACDVTRRRD